MTDPATLMPNRPNMLTPRRLSWCIAVALSLLATDSPLVADEDQPNDTRAAAAVPSKPTKIVPGNGWLVNLERAQKAAEERGKDLLLYFTGSDWSPPCIELEETIFSKPSFIEKFSERFVLVVLDWPSKRETQSKALQESVEQAMETYAVVGHPTLYLTDAQGRPYAKTGFEPLEPEAYQDFLWQLRKKRDERDEHFQVAQSAANPLEKARHIGEALKTFPPEVILRFYESQLRQATEWDPEEAGGLGHVVYFEKKKNLEKELDRYSDKKNWYAVLARIERFQREVKFDDPQQEQEIEFAKLASYYHLKDFEGMKGVLETCSRLKPDSSLGKRTARFLEIFDDFVKREAQQAQEIKE